MAETKQMSWDEMANTNPPTPLNAPQTAGSGETSSAPAERLRSAVIGSNYIARAINASMDAKSTDIQMVDDLDGLDEMLAWRPNIVFVCTDIPLMKNDTLDDSNFINIVNKVAKGSQAGVCIKTTINVETIDRLISTVGQEWFVNKVVYSPELGETSESVLNNDLLFMGGHPDALDALSDIIRHTTHMSSAEVLTGTPHEVVFASLGIAGFKAVKQTFFNQFHQSVIDIEGANPMIVRRMMEKSPIMTDKSLMVPTFVRAMCEDEMLMKKARAYGGEYSNTAVKMMVGMTDRLTVLDECINLRNLKD